MAVDEDLHDVVFFSRSLPPSVTRLAKHLRGHWGVENSLHWSLDVTFGEDRSRIRLGNAPEIAGALRRLALSILKRDTSVKKDVGSDSGEVRIDLGPKPAGSSQPLR